MKIGILGAGQLAQLLAESAYQLGLKTLCFSDSADVPAARLSPLFLGDLKDPHALQTFAQQCDVITLENENIDIGILEFMQQYAPVFPGIEAVRVAQDRLLEKTLFQQKNIPTPLFAAIDSLADLSQAIATIGLPAILKTRRFGYDGKGQVVIKTAGQAADAWAAIGEVPAILEGFVDFDFEVSMIAARNASQAMVFYPLIKNKHDQGILRISESPFIHLELQKLAETYITRLLTQFEYVGVLAFEFFVQGNQLIANEIAPRVHNSGHLTIEGFNVSQFETHLRSVTGLPLVHPVLRAPTVMKNIIGTFPVFLPEEYAHMHVYDYGKPPRPGRKLGHTVHF